MTVHHNMPFSLPLIVGRCYVGGHDADETSDVLIGSEIEPNMLGTKKSAKGQIIEYWLIVQNEVPMILVYNIGMPEGLEDGESFDVGYRTVAYQIQAEYLQT